MEAWQSELSLAIIEQSLISLKELYSLAVAGRTRAINSALDKKIQQQFVQAIQLSQSFDEPLIKTIVEADQLLNVIELQNEVSRLESLIRSDLFAELNLATQFNSLDGD